MGRMYVPSTPASRGEAVEEQESSFIPDGVSAEEFQEVLEAAAAELGFRLVPIEPDDEGSGGEGDEGAGNQSGAGGQGGSPGGQGPQEPAGNASTEAWAEYARAKGATDADLVDDQGEPLGQRALRDKFGTKS